MTKIWTWLEQSFIHAGFKLFRKDKFNKSLMNFMIYIDFISLFYRLIIRQNAQDC